MNPEFVILIVQFLANALLLFASSVIISALNINPKQDGIVLKILTGLILGFFAVVIMYNAINFGNGVIYDTRTILVSVVAYFFPFETALTTTIIAFVYRFFFIGGSGRYAGVASIIVALLAGLLFKAIKKQFVRVSRFVYYYLLGLVASVWMLLTQLLMPSNIWRENLPKIILPILLLYPVITVLVSLSMRSQIVRLDASRTMRNLQSLMKASLDAPEQTSIFALNKEYEYLFFNKYHHDFMLKHDRVDVYEGMNLINQIDDLADRKETKTLYDKALNGEAFTIFRQFSVDDKMVYFKNNYGPVFDDENQIIGLAVVATEITQQKQLEIRLRESEESHRLLIAKMGQSLALHELVFDEFGKPQTYRFLQVNDAFLELFNLRAEEVVGKTKEEVFPNTSNQWLDTFKEVAVTTNPMEYEAYSKLAKKHLHYSVYCPKPNQFATIITDISQRILSLKQLEDSESKFKNAVNEAPIAIMMTLETGEIIQINNRFTQILGYKKQDLTSLADWYRLAYNKSVDNMDELITTSFTKLQRRHSGEQRIKTKDGSDLVCDIYEAIIGKNQDGNKILMNVVIDITDKKRQDDEILFLSYHDPLTGLYNRRYYDQSLWSLRQEQHLPLSIIMADINGLKFTNDAFGHAVGDQLILRVRDLFQKFERPQDIVCRTGGDEFVVFLPKTTYEEALQIIEAINLEMEKMMLNGVTISVSLGLATCKDSRQMEDTIRLAEIDMYNKKLYELSSKRSESLKAIISALNLKSPSEEIHSKNVANHAIALGQSLNMKKDELNLLRLMGNLHDIGKIAIDEQILNKVEPLTPIEWQEIRKHPETGYRILAATVEYIDIAQDILCHHERIDGTGYPKGLKGNDIPLRARIIAIADAYEAMTSVRPYAKQMTKLEAAKELKRCAGTQFDLRLTQRFVENYLKFNWKDL